MNAENTKQNTDSAIAELARTIQAESLPESLIEREDVAITARLHSGTEVGGDYFDFFFTDDTHLVFICADIAGKGIDTALFLYQLRPYFRGLALERLNPAEILTRVNKMLAPENRHGHFAAVFFGLLNTRTGKLTYADAGHVPPLLSRNGEPFEVWKPRKNPVLAILETTVYRGGELMLSPGDRLYLQSSGTFSLANRSGERLSRETLLSWANENREKTGETFLDAMGTKTDDFFDNEIPGDDRTDFLVEYLASRDTRLETAIPSADVYDKFGAAKLTLKTKELFDAGFEYADIVNVRIGDLRLEMPVVPDFRFLRPGETGLVAWPDERSAMLCTFCGDFAGENKLRETIPSYPAPVRIKLAKEGGYSAEYVLRNLVRSNEREAYPELDDENFANVRNVVCGEILPGRLYRGSSPVDPLIGRNVPADTALRKYGVRTVINLDNDENRAMNLAGYPGSYYATTDILYAPIDTDYASIRTRESLSRVFRTFAEKEGPYYVHCIEGQDRTGFVIAVLELFSGATLAEITEDYMRTFYNYYGVEPGSVRFNSLMTNIQNNIIEAFGITTLRRDDLRERADLYLAGLGLTDEERNAVSEHLTK